MERNSQPQLRLAVVCYDAGAHRLGPTEATEARLAKYALFMVAVQHSPERNFYECSDVETKKQKSFINSTTKL